jgi:Glycosyltransferase
VLEAMASSCAIVGTDIPGIRELLTDGTNGRLVPPGDPEALADAIDECGEDPEALDRFRAAALETARANSWRSIAERYLALFEQAIAANGQPVLP